MNVFARMCRRNLKKRKLQTVLIVAAMTLSVMLMALCLILAQSIQRTMREDSQTVYGEYQLLMRRLNDTERSRVMHHAMVDRVGSIQTVGVQTLPEGAFQQPASAGYWDETALSLGRIQVLDGRLPEKPGEVALEEATCYRLNLPVQTGSTLSLSLQAPDGQGGYDAHKFGLHATVVGIVSSYNTAWDALDGTYPGVSDLPGILLCQQEAQSYSASRPHAETLLLSLAPGLSSWDTHVLDALLPETADSSGEMRTNGHILGIDWIQQDTTTLISVLAVLFILVLTTALGIANAFSAVAKQRMEQLRLLRSLGATRRQAASLIWYEAFLLSCVSVPAGLILAAALARGCLALLSGLAHAAYTYVLSPWVLVASGLVGWLTIWAAAWIPAWRAGRLRLSGGGVSYRHSRLRTAIRPGVGRQSWMPAYLAFRSLRMNKVSTLLIVGALCMSMLLMDATALFIQDTQTQGKTRPADFVLSAYAPYDYSFSVANSQRQGFTEGEAAGMANLTGVEGVKAGYGDRLTLLASKEQLTGYLVGATWSDPASPVEDFMRLQRQRPSPAQRLDPGEQRYALSLAVQGVRGSVLDEVIEALQLPVDREALRSGRAVLVYGRDYVVIQGKGSMFCQSLESYEQLGAAFDVKKGTPYTFSMEGIRAGDVWTLSQLQAEPGTTPTALANALDSPDGAIPAKLVRGDVTVAAVLTDADYAKLPERTRQQLQGQATVSGVGADNNFVHILMDLDGYLNHPDFQLNRQFETVSVYLTDSAYVPSVHQELERLVQKRSNANLYNTQEAAELNRRTNTMIRLIAYSLAGIIAVLALSGIFTTMSSRILGRERELGLLRAVGMERGQFSSMLFLEAASYGLMAMGLSLLILCAAMGLLQAVNTQPSWIDGWYQRVNWLLVLAQGVVAALAGMLAVQGPLSRFFRRNVIGNLMNLN
jgi:ABC-type antimicrobial peptide transport system permease subunit